MHAAALLAIATVEPHARTPFNFSPESLQNADDMIRRLPQTVSQTNRNEELFYACVCWGAYLGEVLRTHHQGATWTENEHADSAQIYAIQLHGQTIYPCQWAIDRLQQGESANVWKRYQNLAHPTQPDAPAHTHPPDQ